MARDLYPVVAGLMIAVLTSACAKSPPSVDIDPVIKGAMAGCTGSLTAVNQASVDAAINKASLSVKAGATRSNALESALTEILSSIPEAERPKAYNTYVDCFIRTSRAEGVSLGVAVSIPTGWTLKAAIDRLVGDESSVARYEGCTAEFLGSELEPGRLQALTTAKLIELLPYRLKSQTDVPKVGVATPEAGIYAITCA
jgi:hypothetical protein